MKNDKLLTWRIYLQQYQHYMTTCKLCVVICLDYSTKLQSLDCSTVHGGKRVVFNLHRKCSPKHFIYLH